MSERPRHYTAYEVPKKPMQAGTDNRFARLARPKAPGWRSKRPGMSAAHLVNIRSLPCSVCEERSGIQCHHLKSAAASKERGVFLKATDRWGVPLCGCEHHPALERIGSRREREWFAQWGIDPHALAQDLWNARRDPIRMDFVLRAHKQQAVRMLSAERRLVVNLDTCEWRRV